MNLCLCALGVWASHMHGCVHMRACELYGDRFWLLSLMFLSGTVVQCVMLLRRAVVVRILSFHSRDALALNAFKWVLNENLQLRCSNQDIN